VQPIKITAKKKTMDNTFIDECLKEQNLVRVSDLETRLKKECETSDFKARHIHVIGAGTMGKGIATWCALKGIKVTLQDINEETIESAIEFAGKYFRESNHVESERNLISDHDGSSISDADIVIESIVEMLEPKQILLKHTETLIKNETILATNTSSLSLEALGSSLKNPTRLVGLHFFNPVTERKLVEVVKGPETSREALNNSLAFIGQIDRLPLQVRSSPGYLLNRTFVPYIIEAMRLLIEGAEAGFIDQAMEKFGINMGPIILMDIVGLEVCLQVCENLTKNPKQEIPELLYNLVKNNKLGQKTGEGFYRFENNRPTGESAYIKRKAGKAITESEIQDRLIRPFLIVAESILNEGVVSDADIFDAGIILAAGFPKWTGGPINYARQKGIYKNLISKIDSYKTA
jgi:3-hydroxyacyl-CoA dehydrogenase / enoyl-CoA hydratase / 3-hydroxybutyryl-CoA epimerase